MQISKGNTYSNAIYLIYCAFGMITDQFKLLWWVCQFLGYIFSLILILRCYDNNLYVEGLITVCQFVFSYFIKLGTIVHSLKDFVCNTFIW